MCNVALAAFDVAFVVSQCLGPDLGGVVADRRAQIDLVFAVLEQLADLVGHQLGELVLGVAQFLGDRRDHPGAVLQAFQAPVEERRMTGLDDRHGVRVGHVRIGFDIFFGERIDGLKR